MDAVALWAALLVLAALGLVGWSILRLSRDDHEPVPDEDETRMWQAIFEALRPDNRP